MPRRTFKCAQRGCTELPLWRPTVHIPVGRGPRQVVVIPLPVVVCTAHKLPQRHWPGLTDPTFLKRLREKYGAAALIDRAWIVHEVLPAQA